ncbi:MAG TPA: type VI secretion system baseplate subunit TssF [Noviherbaspirillum sp.]|uniref:type VI secretion system baseplate subunit TssF n=1 Tax=Noviherbaspirillum sp. TaxID=1926288 RepID=UPI002B49B18B|nr:type VI secretion system baseplate subunit TssF [Noviherbaspirillum sp.]HJV85035.1 type VI secretion system baseplate subunit TssF [Noviherbaspirillum sp.]
MDTLLPYYERELTFLRKQSSEFARRFPKVASRLLLSGETCEDPHVERLVESFAFLSARIHKKLDDQYPEFTDSLLQVLCPQYLRPFPSVSIAHFDTASVAARLAGAVRIPRHTTLVTRPVRGIPCRFRTAYDVTIWPISVVSAAYETVLDVSGLSSYAARMASSAIRFDLAVSGECGGFGTLAVERLRFFLNGDPAIVARIREALFSHAVGLWVILPETGQKLELPLSAIIPVGFADEEMLLDAEVRSHPAGQLMLEYFSFPEKFNFFDLDLRALKGKIPQQGRRLEVRVGLGKSEDRCFPINFLARVDKDNFVLGCTPVVNLFQQAPEPIRVTGTETSYPLIVDSRRPYAYEVYEIKRVFRVRKDLDGDHVNEFHPFFSIRHGDAHDSPAHYWHASYLGSESADSHTMELSLVDSSMSPQREETNTLSLELMCTNRDLPSQLPFGLQEGDLFIDGGSVAKAIRLLRKPTPSYRFRSGHGAQWRLISQLSLNHLGLSGQGVEAIKEILTLHDITQAATNSRQISGITAIDHRATTARIAGDPFPSFVRGVEVRVSLDETHYAGVGLFTFAQVLDRFFGLFVHANSFSQLTLVSRQTGQELIKCPARNGAAILA